MMPFLQMYTVYLLSFAQTPAQDPVQSEYLRACAAGVHSVSSVLPKRSADAETLISTAHRGCVEAYSHPRIGRLLQENTPKTVGCLFGVDRAFVAFGSSLDFDAPPFKEAVARCFESVADSHPVASAPPERGSETKLHGSGTRSEATGLVPDFFIHLPKCSTTIAISGGRLETIDAPGSLWTCARASRRIRCELDLDGERKVLDFEVELESPPLLRFKRGDDAMDYVHVNTQARSAASTTRIINTGGLAMKVCSGLYLTADDAKALQSGSQ